MNVIGLDLSLNGTGICVSDRQAFTIAGKSADGDRRLVAIEDALTYYVRASRPELAVIEGLPFGNNDRQVALVHGVARAVLARHRVSAFAYIYPSALKLFAVGDGAAGKPEMAAEAVQLGAYEHFDHDQIDAWWLRRAGLAVTLQTPMDARQAAVLGGVEWPPLVRAYGEVVGRTVTRKCGHKMVCLKHRDRWLHPFSVSVCDKPPK